MWKELGLPLDAGAPNATENTTSLPSPSWGQNLDQDSMMMMLNEEFGKCTTTLWAILASFITVFRSLY